jgi:DNA-binding NarL/FixJ family response regulator
LLAAGRTLGRAAGELHLSRRTTDRRLRSAWEKLGAWSTSEAIVEYFGLYERPR